ncbi:MAG: UDP-glucose 4-epimerase GalE [Candidatus Latescibacterota bacterium]|nr:MAG: UDP-glucose 4-epimerase GalE [Candidatus Latescibacterota bacterium]
MKLCVTGGAGYIGSIVAQALIEGGHEVTVLDNVSTGHAAAVPDGCRFIRSDIRDADALAKAFGAGVEAVLHFAAFSVVSDSVNRPLVYFDNNIGGTIHLLESMERFGVKRIVFSSSAAVYGEPEKLPIVETDFCKPSNPYGFSKLVVEQMLRASRDAWGLEFVSLRYFNAGGSVADHGEHHEPETHLIPIVLDVAAGYREKFTIFGDDYDTPDGTCLRDYIHVYDLAVAHILALSAMDHGFSGVLNLGSDRAFTVLDVVKAVERVTGKKVRYEIGARRPGDPPALLASSKEAERVLGWKKTRSSLEEIIRSAYEWRLRHPKGYPS